MNSIATNTEAVYKRIHAAASRVGRKAEDITLVAVSKTYPVETVIEAYQAGLQHFGENRVPEGADKIGQLSQWLNNNTPNHTPVQWHFIGHIQSRQVKTLLAGPFNLLHSIDSVKLAQRIDRLANSNSYPPIEALLQCNVSGEKTKSGFALNNWPEDQQQLDDFYQAVTQIHPLNNIAIKGLMTMAPWSSNPANTRPIFKRLALLKNQLRIDLPQVNWQHLSMGMTDDFEIAIEEGATIVRVGRALFGQRTY